ncbi:hypothetical protein D6833_04175 [Candidatus Parcubacteria bacterium]|nr:MAG: hypothetical protein D6833_04175 [Candidatus Parcubacteria bacterium]
MANWKVGAKRDLPIASTERAWDGSAARGRIFAWAGWDDNPQPSKARRAFLAYDAEEPELKGSYKLPFADVVDGVLKAIPSGLRAAASRLPQTDIPSDVKERARSVLDGYFKRMEENEQQGAFMLHDVISFELTDDVLVDGKPFAGFAAGKFVDMRGRLIRVKPEDLDEYLANTKAMIESHQEKGHPGLPIDSQNHDRGRAAGWIVDVSRGVVKDSEGNDVPALFFVAKWTKLGVELIQSREMANFSATFNDKDKVILGGSLTNWPATRDGNDVPLLDAIELCMGGYGRGYPNLQDESLDERLREVRDAWYEEYGLDEDAPYIREVFDEFVVVQDGSAYYRVGYGRDEDGEIKFADEAEWVKVKPAWVEAQRSEDTIPDNGEDENEETGGKDMEKNLTLDALTEEERQALLEQAKAELARSQAASDADGEDKEDLLERLREQVKLDAFRDVTDVAKAREVMLSQIEAAMRAEYERMQAQAGKMLQSMLAEIRRDQEIAEFAHKVTAGTDEVPYGLPVQEDEVETFLRDLDDGQRAAAMNLIERIWKKGRVAYKELGHGGQVQGTTPLPEYFARKLDAGEMTVADLSDPVLGLGDIRQYDLTRWMKEA